LPAISDNISKEDIIFKEEYKIVKYAPLNNKLLIFLEYLMMKTDIKTE
jgi:hypothetical protein